VAFDACADKVNEAYHFLVLMRVAELAPEGDGVPARLQGDAPFRFAFSAFNSAARSVLYLLQEEGAHVPGFTRWYVTARERWLKSETAAFFGDRREFRLVFHGGVMAVPVPHASLARNRVEPVEPVELPAISTEDHGGHVRFWDPPGELVTEVCARYLETLTALVKEAEKLAG
jgi:hypothetical protein